LACGVRIKIDSALNTAFSDWGNILYNTIIATAIADRLVENSEVFLLSGDSFRKAGKNPSPPAE
jgi:DNA replication protein DnaC